jgi:superfamily II RNA helicase
LERIGVPETAPFVADPFQLEALAALERSDVLVTASTGSGKTWIAVKAMEEVLARGSRSWYASPLKALSNSKYTEFCQLFGKGAVGILTGDRKENPQAEIIVGTTEILRNQLYDAMHRGEDLGVELVVLDETHYLADEDRGVVWEEVMIYLPPQVRLLLLSATVSNAVQIAGWLEWLRKVPCLVVEAHERPVPIYPLFMFPSGEVTPLSQRKKMAGKVRHFLEHHPQKGSISRQGVANFSQIIAALGHLNLLPAIFFLTSRADCNRALHAALPRHSPSERDEERRHFHGRLRQLLNLQPYLKGHRQLSALRNGRVAAHHGGQLPQWKVLVEALMKDGLLDAIFSTSTVAAGVNFPARSVVLPQSDRFNGREFVPLSATDLHQMTGRAGRRGMDRVGFVAVLPGRHQDPHLILDLLHSLPEPINSQIQISFSMVLNLLLSHRAEDIRKLLARSFATYQNFDEHGVLLEELKRLEMELSAELGDTECGELDTVLRTISRKRELEQNLEEARKELRWSKGRLFKKAYLNPGRLFRNKKGDLFVTLRQESRNQKEGVIAIRVRPGSSSRRSRLRKRFLQLEKVASLLAACLDPTEIDENHSRPQPEPFKKIDTSVILEFKEPLPSPEQEVWENLKKRAEDLETQIASLPCEYCPHLQRCEPEKRSKFRERISRVLSLRHRVDIVTNTLWYEFNRYFIFLGDHGYLDQDGRLSTDGKWASQLRLDQPLMIAECIRQNVFPQNDPAVLAALVAPFVSDRDTHGEPLERLNRRHPDLGQAFGKMVSALHPLRRDLRLKGFAVGPLSLWPAAAIYVWAKGAHWGELIEISGQDEGDLAMLIYRTADSLRQLEGLSHSHLELASSATRAIQSLLREPVEVVT